MNLSELHARTLLHEALPHVSPDVEEFRDDVLAWLATGDKGLALLEELAFFVPPRSYDDDLDLGSAVVSVIAHIEAKRPELSRASAVLESIIRSFQQSA